MGRWTVKKGAKRKRAFYYSSFPVRETDFCTSLPEDAVFHSELQDLKGSPPPPPPAWLDYFDFIMTLVSVHVATANFKLPGSSMGLPWA